jgi:hypothetical protein
MEVAAIQHGFGPVGNGRFHFATYTWIALRMRASIRCMKSSVPALRGNYFRMATSGAVAAVFLRITAGAFAQEPIKIPMTADRWETNENIKFEATDGYPLGVMTVSTGVAVLKDFKFRNGTIEFDVIPRGPMGAGIGFRRRDEDTYEDFYLRPRPKCDEAVDCIQYAPQTHGVLLWDVFPQYQSPAPVEEKSTNHIKMVINGRRMNIYVNPAANGSMIAPTLAVGRLEGDALEGGISMQGPGTFANLTVAPDAVEGLSPEPVSDATSKDKRYLRNWMIAPPASLPDGKEPAFAEMPDASQGWQPLSAERGGLVDLSREYGLAGGRKVRALAWLKTDIASDNAQTKHVSIGWSREIWVFVNGKRVFADKNLYQPLAARKVPDGRLSLENGSFDLPLQKGKNEIAVALANNFYGWGIEMRIGDLKGVKVAESKSVLAAQK